MKKGLDASVLKISALSEMPPTAHSVHKTKEQVWLAEIVLLKTCWLSCRRSTSKQDWVECYFPPAAGIAYLCRDVHLAPQIFL